MNFRKNKDIVHVSGNCRWLEIEKKNVPHDPEVKPVEKYYHLHQENVGKNQRLTSSQYRTQEVNEMTSRGNQSVSPPPQLSQQRHLNAVSSVSPPPNHPYFTGASSTVPQFAYEILPQSQPYLPYQVADILPVSTYGNSINDIRGAPNHNGRAGPLPQNSYYHQQMGTHIRAQQMPQGPTANQGFISAQGPGTYCQPRPQSQPQQFLYCSFPPQSNVYMPTMYGGHPTVSVYPQGPYLPSYQSNMQGFQNGLQWRSQGMAPAGAQYTSRPQPREKKILNITDPNTGRSITSEIFSNKPHSADAEDYYEQVPPVNKNKEICQTFTRLVADRLKSPDESGSLEAPPDSQGAVGGSPAGPSVTSQQYQQPPPQQQVHQLPHPQQQPQQQPQPSKGPSPMIRAPMNEPPPSAMQHQVMPPRPGLIQQPPASVTPPHDIQHQLPNLSVPPPHLPMRQPNQPAYTSAIQQQQHHTPHHPQTPPQQQAIRPQMLPSMPAALQQIQTQSPHYTPPNQSPPYNQISPANITHHSIAQPFKTDVMAPERQMLQAEAASSHSNIPIMSGSLTTQTQAPRTASPAKEVSSGSTGSDPIGDMKSNFTPSSSLKSSSSSFGEDEHISVKPEDNNKDETFQGANFQGTKDVRKGKKNLKDLNRKDIGGSDMDAFIDKVDVTAGGAAVSESDISKTNNALELSIEPAAVNGACLLEGVTRNASFEGELEATQGAYTTSKDPESVNSKTAAQKNSLDANQSGNSLENGHSKDNHNIQKTQEHQKQSTTSAQVEVKNKQKKKKKKGHQSPPIQKSKQGTPPSDNAEKQNETVETDSKISLDIGNTDLRDKSVVQQEKNSARQDKSAVQQDKSYIRPDKSILQDKPAELPDKTAGLHDRPAAIPDKPTNLQDKSTVLQDMSSVLQDKSADRQDTTVTSQETSFQQIKPTTQQEKISSQNRTVHISSPPLTQAPKTTHKDSLPQPSMPGTPSLPQQRQAEGKPEKTFLKEDKPSTPPSITSSVILDSSPNPLGIQNQQASSSIQTNHVLIEQTKHSDSSVPQDVSAECVKTGDTSEVDDHQVTDNKSDPLYISTVNQESVDTQKEEIYGTDDFAASKKTSIDKTVTKARKGGKEKLQYDRAYLMELRDCPSSQTKPVGLPDLDIILPLPLVSANRVTTLDFTPSFFQPTGNTRISSQIGKTNSRSRQRSDVQMPQRVIKSVSLQDSVKPLHQSEKPWKPSPKQLSAGEIAEKRKTLESEVLFIMNRLTPTNFERLAEEMRNLDIKTSDDLQDIVKIFFDKVTIETKFVEAYAKLCKVMSEIKIQPSSNTTTKENTPLTFQVAMLTKCQQEFEADKTTIFEDPEERRKKMEAELPDSPERAAQIEKILYQMKMKRLKFYGNIRFIGELFKLKMLTENIMHDCIYRLLKAKDDDSLLSLCNLVTTVGQLLDTEKAKSKMDQYFAQMAKIADEQKSRIKFTLKDVIDLRKNNWVPRKEQTAPKKIDEVHKDFHQEQATKQFLQSQPLPPRLEAAQTNAKRVSRQRQDDRQMTDDGWNMVSTKSQRIDASKMRLSKNVVDENSIQLGPGGGMKQFSMWGKGSFGGTQPSQEHERSPAGNRFSALKYEDDRRGHQRSPTRGDSGSLRGPRHGQMSGHGQGKILSRSSQEGERRDMLARSGAGATSQDSSRENSRNREDSRQSATFRESDSSLARSNVSHKSDLNQSRPAATLAAAGAASTAYNDQGMRKVKPLSEEEMEQKARTILEEYLSALDLEEAKLCMMELDGQRYLSLFVMTCINDVLEKSNRERDLAGTFFHQMIRHSLLPLDVYFQGLTGVLENAEDMVIDIPKIWTYLAQIIVPILDDVSVSWSKLSTALISCLDTKYCAKLIAEILLIAKEKTSEREVAEMWQGSLMDWSTFLSAEEKGHFLKDKKLEFTVQPVVARPPSRTGDFNQVDLQKMIEDIESIVHRGGSKEEIYACIRKFSGAEKVDKSVIRAVVTAVVNGSISHTAAAKKVNDDLFKIYKEVLQHYLQNMDLEVQALYAIQALMHKLEHPSGVITQIFNILYDEEVISEDAIKQWERSRDPREVEGKGACIMQLTQFITWLRENEEPEPS